MNTPLISRSSETSPAKGFLLLIFLGVPLLILSQFSTVSAAPPPMRPYSGIGLLLLSNERPQEGSTVEPLHLYQEPALSRSGELNIGALPRYPWIFGPLGSVIPLFVSARKGDWLRVAYDDSGREAWLKASKRHTFLSWEVFLKGRGGQMLPGLQKRHYSLYQQPGRGEAGVMAARQHFRIIRSEGDWIQIMPDQHRLGWVRWRDEDGRLLIGPELR